jgi:xanthine dehydrogenase YagS FAD-binding subunit
MADFEYVKAGSLPEAVELLGDGSAGAVAIAGGTDILPQVRDGIVSARRLVDVAAISGMADIVESVDGTSIGAGATIADIAAHPVVRRDYTALAEAAGGLATPQIRNVGTLGGNLNQRPRCWYYRNPLVPCLKKGGDHCYALAGTTKYLCVTGGDRCYIVHPSDMGVALAVLDARLELSGPNGQRELRIVEFFAGPGHDVTKENVLEPGELVTRVLLPGLPGAKSVYLKVREREAGDFALVSVAAKIAFGPADGGRRVISQSRISLGGVAPVPYRATEVEAYLDGLEVSDVDAAQAGGLTLSAATPLPQNGYKVPMARNLVKQALNQLLASLL